MRSRPSRNWTRTTYDNKGFTLRGTLSTHEGERYPLGTIKPLSEADPKEKRPAHIHVNVSSGKSPVLTTQLHFKGDPWNHQGPAVQPSLMLAPRGMGSRQELRAISAPGRSSLLLDLGTTAGF